MPTPIEQLADELIGELAAELAQHIPPAIFQPVMRFLASEQARKLVKDIIAPRVTIDARGDAPHADIRTK